MISQECSAELRSSWLPNITDAGLDRLIDLLEKASPLLIHGCFTRSVPMGCLATHAAWNHPRTAHLNQEAGIAMGSGNRIGLNITPAEAIAWITLNPAKAMGIADRTGSLEPGKMADLVLWNANPFSIYAKADKVFIDGGLAFDRADPRYQPKSDFELGQPGEGAFQ